MDIQTRKIEMIQAFLQIQDEALIEEIERLLALSKGALPAIGFAKLTEEELQNRIEQSECDFANHQFKTTAQLLSKY